MRQKGFISLILTYIVLAISTVLVFIIYIGNTYNPKPIKEVDNTDYTAIAHAKREESLLNMEIVEYTELEPIVNWNLYQNRRDGLDLTFLYPPEYYAWDDDPSSAIHMINGTREGFYENKDLVEFYIGRDYRNTLAKDMLDIQGYLADRTGVSYYFAITKITQINLPDKTVFELEITYLPQNTVSSIEIIDLSQSHLTNVEVRKLDMDKRLLYTIVNSIEVDCIYLCDEGRIGEILN